ncbi:MAG TPA: LuxR C-terminal-related transcriptional regulator [Chloroflexota bacterium]|nr:LuxR C-terminal-related transcriptional regulator [Chloroflexota bacterium]
MPAIPTPRPSPPELTPRQRELLRLIASGYTENQIGDRLGLTRGTIKEHLARARERLRAVNTVHAAVLAIKAGLLDVSTLSPRRVKPRRWSSKYGARA